MSWTNANIRRPQDSNNTDIRSWTNAFASYRPTLSEVNKHSLTCLQFLVETLSSYFKQNINKISFKVILIKNIIWKGSMNLVLAKIH